jgi:phosphatidylserine/phosphatidylglycerophosphate/cardiolipin synthase-like enzyme
MFINIPSREIRKVTDVDAFAAAHIAGFLREIWVFGAPWPDVFYDSRQTADREFVSLHAKCVVVDEREALLTSANFTSRGMRAISSWGCESRIPGSRAGSRVGGRRTARRA